MRDAGLKTKMLSPLLKGAELLDQILFQNQGRELPKKSLTTTCKRGAEHPIPWWNTFLATRLEVLPVVPGVMTGTLEKYSSEQRGRAASQ